MAGVRDNTVSNIASGGIASFKSVGEVPLKSLKVNFSPIQEGEGDPSPSNIRAITGWTECNLHKNGKNLFNTEIVKGAITTADGTITVYTSGDRNRLVSYYIEIPKGTYTISCKENKQVNVYFYTKPDSSGYVSSERLTSWETMPRTFTTTERRFVAFVFRNSDNSYLSPSDMTEVQIEVGSNATSYEPYNGTTVPVSWSDLGAVYGGYVDIISGEIWATHAIDSDLWKNWSFGENLGNNTRKTLNTSYNAIGGNASDFSLCNITTYLWSNSNDSAHFYVASNGRTLYAILPNDLDENQEVQISYKLATPVLIGTIDPITIKSLIGTNNIWSNADTVEAQYCALESLQIYKQRFKTNQPHLQSVSGDIVSFQTDMIAFLKECKVYFEPIQASGTPSPDNVLPISGWNNIILNQSGKNMFDINTLAVPDAITVNNGVATGSMRNFYTNFYVNGEMFEWGKNERLYLSVKAYRDNPQADDYAGMTFYGKLLKDGIFTLARFSNDTGTPTTLGGATYNSDLTKSIGIAYGSQPNAIWHVSEIQIELGTTGTEYEPYNGSTESITLPSTCYGGYVDLINGEIWATYEYTNLGEKNWTADTQTTQPGCFRAGNSYFSGIKYMGANYCSQFTAVQKSSWTAVGYGEISVTNSTFNPIVRVRDERFIDKTGDEVKALLSGVYYAYERAVPRLIGTITPTQIKTLKGINNIWSNTNSTTQVKYWTHGSIADKRKVVWNQWMKELNANNFTAYNSNNINVSFSDGIATIEYLEALYSYRTAIKSIDFYPVDTDDIIYSSFEIKQPENDTTWGSETTNRQNTMNHVPANTWTKIAFIVNSNSTNGVANFILPECWSTNNVYVGLICQIRKPLIINLTQMFGEGNEPSTAAEFEALCSRNGIDLTQYQPYDEGTQMYWYF